MGDVVRFVPMSELERARLVREARAIYQSVFPDDKRSRQSKLESLAAAKSDDMTEVTPTTQIVELIQGHGRGRVPNDGTGQDHKPAYGHRLAFQRIT